VRPPADNEVSVIVRNEVGLGDSELDARERNAMNSMTLEKSASALASNAQLIFRVERLNLLKFGQAQRAAYFVFRVAVLIDGERGDCNWLIVSTGDADLVLGNAGGTVITRLEREGNPVDLGGKSSAPARHVGFLHREVEHEGGMRCERLANITKNDQQVVG
jgi:hypothetical protein